jgi:hypothetical protein
VDEDRKNAACSLSHYFAENGKEKSLAKSLWKMVLKKRPTLAESDEEENKDKSNSLLSPMESSYFRSKGHLSKNRYNEQAGILKYASGTRVLASYEKCQLVEAEAAPTNASWERVNKLDQNDREEHKPLPEQDRKNEWDTSFIKIDKEFNPKDPLQIIPKCLLDSISFM